MLKSFVQCRLWGIKGITMQKEYEFFEYMNELQKTTRYSVYNKVFWESVPDHTYKMIVMIDKLFDVLDLKLDYRKCVKLALYHDLGEIGMENDIDAYDSFKNPELKLRKKEMENDNVLGIARKYGNEVYDIFSEFEKQATMEAKFVKAIDRLETTIRCIAVKDVSLEISIEDADITNADFTAMHCDEAIKNFPELMPFYKVVKVKLKERFEAQGLEWKAEYDLV